MSRTPPASSRTIYNDPIQILVFVKNEGSHSSCFMSKLISRVRIRLVLRDGSGTIDTVRYDGRYWPIYKPETFPEKSKVWVKNDDTIYGPDIEPLKVPLQHHYLFDCDNPRAYYD